MSVSFTKRFISQGAANLAVQEALAHAAENGWQVAVVVVDPGGHMVAAGRMDGAAAAVADFALDKARTAVLGKTTRAFAERMLSAPALQMGLANRPNLCAWDGGMPILEEGQLIGAIGVSGAAGPDDILCAEAGVRAIGLNA
ncbi:GlcG/HbpS family heme-binding protein [Ruegeria arenilitoris]|uniref:GlcG/HbpS family heme-binding protein n=1 Tax=Ruegeria arenilitoris TaxID=1173585 RepID=UPI0014818D89|nr:heme-binding protein [Ruegeria arenilitoris]